MGAGAFQPLGLGHEFYVGFDKGTARWLLFFFGAPLVCTTAIAAYVLCHPSVGWSMARVEVWWAARDVSDEEYSSSGPTVIVLLRLVCALPPAACGRKAPLGDGKSQREPRPFQCIEVGLWVEPSSISSLPCIYLRVPHTTAGRHCVGHC